MGLKAGGEVNRSNEIARGDAGPGDATRAGSAHLETTAHLEATGRSGLLIGLIIGVPIVAYGVRGVWVDSARTHPFELARWVVGAALVHDLVAVPAVLALGLAVRWVVRDDQVRRALRVGFIVSGSLSLVAWPFIRGYGRRPAVPSLLPRNYLMGLVVYLTITWVVVACMIVWTGMRRAVPKR